MEWLWSYMAKPWNLNQSKQHTNILVMKCAVSSNISNFAKVITLGKSSVGWDHYFEIEKRMND